MLPPRSVAAALQDAKRVSLGFLHWLQTEAPAEGDRLGRARAPAAARRDGHRGRPRRSIPTSARRGASALSGRWSSRTCRRSSSPARGRRHFADSVGIGWYPIDIHRSGPEDVGVSYAHTPVPDPARRADPDRAREPARRARRTSARRTSRTAATGCIRSSGTSARPPARSPTGRSPDGQYAGADLARRRRDPALPATPARGRRPARLGHRRAARRPCVRRRPDARRRRRADRAGRLSSSSPTPRSSPEEWHAWGGTGEAPPTRRSRSAAAGCSDADQEVV